MFNKFPVQVIHVCCSIVNEELPVFFLFVGARIGSKTKLDTVAHFYAIV